MAAVRPVQFRSDKWTVVTSDEFTKSQETASKELFIVTQFKAIVQGNPSRSSESNKRLSIAYLVDPENTNEKEHLYQTACQCFVNSEYRHGIEILEGLRKRTREVKVLHLLTSALLIYGREIKSKDFLERAYGLSMETLKTANLTSDLRVDFIFFAANAYIELNNAHGFTHQPAALLEMIEFIDPPSKFNIVNERRAQVTLHLSIIRMMTGKCLYDSEQKRDRSDLQYHRAIALFLITINSEYTPPHLKVWSFYYLSLCYFTLRNVNTARAYYDLGMELAKSCCPELVPHYLFLDSKINEHLSSFS